MDQPGDGKTEEKIKEGRIASGVEGLDGILGGGLPGEHLYLVQGGPGVGKTTLALQFLLAGVEAGEPGLYVSLSQSRSELEAIAHSHGWSLDGITITELNSVSPEQAREDQTIFQAADIRLDRTRQAIERAVEETRPKRMVYDSLLEVRQLTGDAERFRREVLGFKKMLLDAKIAAIMIDVTPEKGGDSELESIAHGIVFMEKWLPAYGPARRRMEVRKMRGVNHASGYHDMAIQNDEGVVAFPRIQPAEDQENETGERPHRVRVR